MSKSNEAFKLVEKFNKQFPVGSKVMQRNVGQKMMPYKERTVRSKAFIAASGEPVVIFEAFQLLQYWKGVY